MRAFSSLPPSTAWTPEIFAASSEVTSRARGSSVHTMTSHSTGASPASTPAATFWKAAATAIPGSISAACCAAEPCHTPSVRVEWPPTSLARGTVTSITTAHRLAIRTTSTLMYGHVETPAHWVNQLLLFREIQAETGGFTEFVPLGFVHQNTLLYQQGLARPGPTLAEHLRMHALARVMLAGSIPNIQVSWVKLGRRISQLSMQAGANDYGGTLREENISRLAGATAGEYTSPEEFQARIVELGRIPAERNTMYTKLRFPVGVPVPLEYAAQAETRA